MKILLSSFKNHKVIRWGFLILILLISIKPLLFTWNLWQSARYQNGHPFKWGNALYKSLMLKPGLYKSLGREDREAIEYFLVSAMIRQNSTSLLKGPIKGIMDLEKIMDRYKNNFYFQNLMGGIQLKHQWQDLDEIALQLLIDQEMNPLSLSLLKKIKPTFKGAFKLHLIDYLSWKNNNQLLRKLFSPLNVKRVKANPEISLQAHQSQDLLSQILLSRYQLASSHLGKNMVNGHDFSGEEEILKYWRYSKMASRDGFPRGSFVMGTDQIGNNIMVRLMGFHVSRQTGKSKPRAGLRYREKIKAENGWYLFSFDYLTRTWREKLSVWLCKGMGQKHLPPSYNGWRKAVIFINNSDNKFKFIDPSIWMWGTGTTLIDNAYLAKISKPQFSTSQTMITVTHNGEKSE